MSSPLSPFPPIRRIVTGHNPDGSSTVWSDDKIPSLNWKGASNKRYTRLWVTKETPADNSNSKYVINERSSSASLCLSPDRTATQLLIPYRVDMRNVVPDRGIVSTAGSHFVAMELGPGGKSDVVRVSDFGQSFGARY